MSSQKEKQWQDDGIKAFATLHATTLGSEWAGAIADAVAGANAEIAKVAGSYINNGAGQLAGYYAEAFHAGSFNINAAKTGSPFQAVRDASNGNASADISTNWDEPYGSKYNNSATGTLYEQARPSAPGGPPKYEGQQRLVPSDQLDRVDELASKRIELGKNNPEYADRYRETQERLTDRVKAPDGTESRPLSKPDADQWAEDAKQRHLASQDPKNVFSPRDELFNRENLVGTLEHIASAAGGAAAIAVAMNAAPVVVGGAFRLYRDPEYAARAFGRDVATWAKEEAGWVAVDAFSKASIGGALATAQKAGLLSGPLATASVAELSGVAVVAVEAMKSITAWQRGHCTGEQAMSRVFSCGVRTAASIKGAAIGQALIPIPVVGAVVGGLVGPYLAEKGMAAVSDTTLIKILEEIDRTFEQHQKHVNLLAETQAGYAQMVVKYDEYLIQSGLMLASADRQFNNNEVIGEAMEGVEATGDEAILAARRRLELWNGKN